MQRQINYTIHMPILALVFYASKDKIGKSIFSFNF